MSYNPNADQGCTGDWGQMLYDPNADRGCTGDRGQMSHDSTPDQRCMSDREWTEVVWATGHGCLMTPAQI